MEQRRASAGGQGHGPRVAPWPAQPGPELLQLREGSGPEGSGVFTSPVQEPCSGPGRALGEPGEARGSTWGPRSAGTRILLLSHSLVEKVI